MPSKRDAAPLPPRAWAKSAQPTETITVTATKTEMGIAASGASPSTAGQPGNGLDHDGPDEPMRQLPVAVSDRRSACTATWAGDLVAVMRHKRRPALLHFEPGAGVSVAGGEVFPA